MLSGFIPKNLYYNTPTNNLKMEHLSPPQLKDLYYYKPLIFLAGPIQGAKDWQYDAWNLLQEQDYFSYVANPRKKYLDKEFDYDAQVDWELQHIDRASTNGVVLFWLAKEDVHDPERAYAQTSRWELATIVERIAQGSDINLVVGIEEGFSGARYIKKQLAEQLKGKVCVQNTLDNTIREAKNIHDQRFSEVKKLNLASVYSRSGIKDPASNVVYNPKIT